ncbi:hypothetical protein ACF061_07805 [Streptomyces sp. NPDC015220]|uniref:hypothetical protein n=1 Tax=Streptomyces sp. NPDC015220 TaxID=3364947 RepID=UPI0036FF5993
MTGSQDDSDRVFIRSKWGTNRYVYNPDNPVGVALIVGSLLLAFGGMYWMHRQGQNVGRDGWRGDELRSAVTAASAKLSRQTVFGPGSLVPFESVLQEDIIALGRGVQNGLAVTPASERPKSRPTGGGPEQRDYTVTAEGTTAAFCVHAYAVKREGAAAYDSVTVSVADGPCPAR